MTNGAGGIDNSDIRVLLIDDYEEYVQAGREYLHHVGDGITVVTATAAADGLQRLSDEPIDCIVCDFRMPGMDGIEFLEKIRPDYPDLPCFLLTGHDRDLPPGKLEDLGVLDIITKGQGTHTFEQLRTRIHTITPIDADNSTTLDTRPAMDSTPPSGHRSEPKTDQDSESETEFYFDNVRP